MTKEQWRSAAAFWYDQVDAAAVVEADAKIDGAGRTQGFNWREEEDESKRHGGKMERTPWSYL